MNNRNHPFLSAKWIAADSAVASPLFVRSFFAHNVNKATLHITSLGFFEASVNGTKVTDEMYLPVVTDYEKRDMSRWIYPIFDDLTHRLYYYDFDVTDKVREGQNELLIQLGNGWYKQTERVAEGEMAFGDTLKTIFVLALETESGIQYICSDGSETWKESEIRYTNLFIGEVLDPAACTGETTPVFIVEAPETELSAAIGVADGCIRTITPRLLSEHDGKRIYDAGENISGYVRVRTAAEKGSRIQLRFSEELYEDGSLDFTRIGGEYVCKSGRHQIQQDLFVCDGTYRVFEPKFVWHAFRYFEITGDYDAVEAVVVHSDVSVTSSFESSSEGFNFLYDAFIRSQLTNMHGSIPSDCPHRERLGYTGDGQVCAPAAMLLLDSREFYRKWIQDILDCQDKVGGHVQHTAPMMGGGGGPGGWGCAVVTVPYAYYKAFGEKEILVRCYEPMRRWLSYLMSHRENGLVVREEEGGWCLGDWCTREPIEIPEPFVNTCYLLVVLRLLCEIAKIIKRTEDITEYVSLIAQTEKAICKAYKNEQTGSFCNGVQGADAYAVWVGLSDIETVHALAEKYDALGHFDTGFIATDILCALLTEYGHEDTFFDLLQSEQFGTYLYMKRHGATTVWENWDGGGSHNHPMFGASARYLFTDILGIRQPHDSVAFEKLRIAPCIPNGLDFAKGKLVLPCGEVSVSFERKENGIAFTVCIPENKTAVFVYKDHFYNLFAGVNEIFI